MRIVAKNWENNIKELENRIIAKISSIYSYLKPTLQPDVHETQPLKFPSTLND